MNFKLWHLFLLTGYVALSLAVLSSGIKERPLYLGLSFLLMAGLAILLTVIFRPPLGRSRGHSWRREFDAFVVGPIVGLLVSAGVFFLSLLVLEALLFGLMSTISTIVLVYATPPPLKNGNRSK